MNSADKLYLVMESVKVDTNTPGLPLFLFLLTAREDRLRTPIVRLGLSAKALKIESVGRFC